MGRRLSEDSHLTGNGGMETRGYIGRERGNEGGHFGGDSRNPTLLLFRCIGSCFCRKAWQVKKMAARLSNGDNKGASKGGAAHELWCQGHCQNALKIRVVTFSQGKARFLSAQPAIISSTVSVSKPAIKFMAMLDFTDGKATLLRPT
ncbi:hypothetical protein OIU79_009942 [Salix purpurea]|uniref:Uncharacterized protein n=1 Tax=Salix purpurea TaxID=77065 RepID=A0A9Q0T908_SALPP|nr:hypothetical protein OIU79_009942 [Salix purpurea]